MTCCSDESERLLQVVCDEHVIDEGDDGDNFYVIDRSVTVTD